MNAASNSQEIKRIIRPLLSWWDATRAELPWRRTRDPYAIWVAEIMLQQTQIKIVIPYYGRWMAQFPTVEVLAAASLDDVLKCWEGMGYYGRARHLHEAARTVVEQYGGQIPTTADELVKLKGIGRYTAGAVASIAFGEITAAVDGNVMRVIGRLVDLEKPISDPGTREVIWSLAGDLVPADRPGAFNQALMELGQSVCRPADPACHLCPVAAFCLARERGTQLERPVRPPRARIPHYQVTAGIIRDPAGRILIAQRPPAGLLGGLWEFPGGKQEEGESLPQALRREIAEELMIEIDVGEHLLSLDHAYTHFRITLHVFEARYRDGVIQHIGAVDHSWVTIPELEKFAFAATDRRIIEFLGNSDS